MHNTPERRIIYKQYSDVYIALHIQPPPTSQQELLVRANELAGLTLGEIATQLGEPCPQDLKHHKGWMGNLLEAALGADAGSRPEPDFTQIGVELKTLPISATGTPLETTYVCVAPLTGMLAERWRTSLLYKKLATVLWVPVLAERTIPIEARQIGTPFLWTLTGQQEQYLKQDWEEIVEYINLGRVNEITARVGEYLQLRPKAADGSVRVKAIGQHGALVDAQPKGFYLKKQFTEMLLQQQFGAQQ